MTDAILQTVQYLLLGTAFLLTVFTAFGFWVMRDVESFVLLILSAGLFVLFLLEACGSCYRFAVSL